MHHGRIDEARLVLSDIRRKNGQTCEKEGTEIEAMLQHEQEVNSFIAFVYGTTTRKRKTEIIARNIYTCRKPLGRPRASRLEMNPEEVLHRAAFPRRLGIDPAPERVHSSGCPHPVHSPVSADACNLQRAWRAFKALMFVVLSPLSPIGTIS